MIRPRRGRGRGEGGGFELLNGPTGMTIDPATGALDWYPDVKGDFPVSIAATDTLGLAAAQIFTLTSDDTHHIYGEDFHFVHRGKSEFTPIKACLNKCSINPELLIDRIF